LGIEGDAALEISELTEIQAGRPGADLTTIRHNLRMSGSHPVVDIRPACIGDVALILRFIKELAAYERAEYEVVATEATLRASLFGEAARAHALICRVAGVDAGFAVYFFNYSTWQGRQGLYLEDLYVSPAYRNAGAGKAMLRHLACLAVKQGCGRFEWSVLEWNGPATAFYRSIGAVAMDEWVRYRLAGEALAKFAEGNGSGAERPGTGSRATLTRSL
jgi:GNAT superfamily N-acetyltransferase